MRDLIRNELRDAWRRMARRNGWSLARDEEQFLEQALVELGKLQEDQPLNLRAQMAVRCAYSARLYQGLLDRDETAAQELWLTLFRRALQRGWSEAEAEDLAQEAVARVWEKLSTIRSAQSIFAFAFYMLLTVERKYRTQVVHEAPLTTSVEGDLKKIIDPTELAADVEQRIMSETIGSGLRAALPDNLQRLVLIRVVIFGERPRDVARDLGLPLYRTRLAKSRALERLRKDPAFGELLNDLIDAQEAPDRG